MTKVEYNGSTVVNIENGNIATLPVKGKQMATDIVVTAPGATNVPNPIEISTAAKMTALLTSGKVGGIYKYTGLTGGYENGSLYVLEEVPTSGNRVLKKLVTAEYSDFLYNIVTHLDFDHQFGASNGTLSYPAGPSGLGKAVSLNDGYVSTNLKPGTDSFTLSFWVKNIGITGDPALVSNKIWSSGGTSGFVLAWQPSTTDTDKAPNGRLVFNVGLGDEGEPNADRAYVNVHLAEDYKEWMHVIVVVDRSDNTVKFYINFEAVETTYGKYGEENNSIDVIGAHSLNGYNPNDKTLYPLNIGQDGAGTYDSLNAAVDDFIFFNVALTDTDVAALQHYYDERSVWYVPNERITLPADIPTDYTSFGIKVRFKHDGATFVGSNENGAGIIDRLSNFTTSAWLCDCTSDDYLGNEHGPVLYYYADIGWGVRFSGASVYELDSSDIRVQPIIYDEPVPDGLVTWFNENFNPVTQR